MSLNIIHEQQFENKKRIVNNAIKICIECGNLAVIINGNVIFCKDCNSKFEIKDDD